MSPSRRILVLTPQFPYPPNQGTTLRNYNLIRELSAHHPVDLLSLAEEPPSDCDLGHMRSLCRSVDLVAAPHRATRQRIVDTFAQALPDMGLRLESAEFHRLVEAKIAQGAYDIVQVEGIEMAPYLLQLARPDRPYLIVYDDHNAEYVLQRRAFETDLRKPKRWPAALYSLIQWRKLVRYERRACRAADRLVAVSSADADALELLSPGKPVHVVPNGVDLEYWSGPVDDAPLAPEPAMVFVGKMDFRPNVDAMLWFADKVLPLIGKTHPDAHLYIVGKSPHRRLAPLATHPRITVTGFVDDVRPYVAQARVYVVPLRVGGGTRLKVLQAMAMRKAMVTTTLGCEGIGLTDGEQALLADSAEAFAAAIRALLDDEALRKSLGERAHAFVSARYDWRLLAPLLERVYASAA